MYGEKNHPNQWFRELCWIKTVDETYMKSGSTGMSVYVRSKTACSPV